MLKIKQYFFKIKAILFSDDQMRFQIISHILKISRSIVHQIATEDHQAVIFLTSCSKYIPHSGSAPHNTLCCTDVISITALSFIYPRLEFILIAHSFGNVEEKNLAITGRHSNWNFPRRHKRGKGLDSLVKVYLSFIQN